MVSFSTPWRSTLFCVVFFAFLLPIFCFSAFYEWFLKMLDIDNIVCHFLHFMWAHYQDEGNSLWFLQEDVPYLKLQEFFRRNIWGQQKPWHFFRGILAWFFVGWMTEKSQKTKTPRSMATFAFNMDALPRQVPIWVKGKSFKFSFGEVFCR